MTSLVSLVVMLVGDTSTTGGSRRGAKIDRLSENEPNTTLDFQISEKQRKYKLVALNAFHIGAVKSTIKNIKNCYLN